MKFWFINVAVGFIMFSSIVLIPMLLYHFIVFKCPEGWEWRFVVAFGGFIGVFIGTYITLKED